MQNPDYLLKHYNIIVIGKVQGVFYRQSTFEIANKLGLNGFARNETNGNVYIEAEAEEEQLKKFIDWCKIGPWGAKVEEVKVTEGEMKNFPGFIIKK